MILDEQVDLYGALLLVDLGGFFLVVGDWNLCIVGILKKAFSYRSLRTFIKLILSLKLQRLYFLEILSFLLLKRLLYSYLKSVS